MRQLTDAQLAEELEHALRSLQNVRFRVATKQMSNTSEIRATRRTIARMRTLIHERELARG